MECPALWDHWLVPYCLPSAVVVPQVGYWYTMSKQSLHLSNPDVPASVWDKDVASVYGFTSTPVDYEQTLGEGVVRPGRRMWRVCAGTLVHYEPGKQSGSRHGA